MEKCFDKLWLEYSINSLYECGLQNDKLNLIYNLNKTALVSVKIGTNVSKKVTQVDNVIMQGSVLAPLQCTVVQDSFNRNIFEKPDLQYFYKDDIDIPIGMLCFVDDTLSIQKCGPKSIEKNAASNSFVMCTKQRKKMIKQQLYTLETKQIAIINVQTYM